MEKFFENAIQSDLVWHADIVFQSKSFVSTYGLDFRQNNTIDRGLKYVGKYGCDCRVFHRRAE